MKISFVSIPAWSHKIVQALTGTGHTNIIASTVTMRHFKYLCLLILLLSGQAFAQDTSVRVIEPLIQTVDRVSSQPATAEAFYVADLGAMVSGQIEEVLVDIGDRVTNGQVLARINVPDVLANIESQRANVDALESEYERSTSI